MKEERLKHFEKILLEEREKLLSELLESNETAMNLIENDMLNVNDAVDQASSSTTQTILSVINNNNRQKILAIEASLRRITEKSFGKCVSCGTDISNNRLESVPWTTQCIKCKTKGEKQH